MLPDFWMWLRWEFKWEAVRNEPNYRNVRRFLVCVCYEHLTKAMKRNAAFYCGDKRKKNKDLSGGGNAVVDSLVWKAGHSKNPCLPQLIAIFKRNLRLFSLQFQNSWFQSWGNNWVVFLAALIWRFYKFVFGTSTREEDRQCRWHESWKWPLFWFWNQNSSFQVWLVGGWLGMSNVWFSLLLLLLSSYSLLVLSMNSSWLIFIEKSYWFIFS